MGPHPKHGIRSDQAGGTLLRCAPLVHPASRHLAQARRTADLTQQLRAVEASKADLEQELATLEQELRQESSHHDDETREQTKLRARLSELEARVAESEAALHERDRDAGQHARARLDTALRSQTEVPHHCAASLSCCVLTWRRP